MKLEQDDVCVQCGKPIPAQGLGVVCYSCGKEDNEKPMRTDEVRDDSIRIVCEIKWSENGECVADDNLPKKKLHFLKRLLRRSGSKT